MATAPDPKEAAAELAADEKLRMAKEQAEFRDQKMVLWLFLGGVRRVLRWSEVSARQVGMLKRAGVDANTLFTDLVRPGGGDLDVFVAAWWLAGMQTGVTGETYETLLDIRLADQPVVHLPTDEERTGDTGGALLDPPG